MPGGGRAALARGLVALVLVAACGSAAPQGSPPPTDITTQAPVAPVSPASDAVEIIDFDDASGPAAPAQREFEQSQALRVEAGFGELVGEDRQAAVGATFDAIAAEFSQTSLEQLAQLVDSGQLPAGRLPAGLLATRGGSVQGGSSAAGSIDLSLFSQTGFTTSALLSMATGLIQRADESQSGSVPRQDHREQTADGLRQVVDLNMTWTVQTGGGRVTAQVTMSATDNIFDAATGSFVALYTSTTEGSFDVEACPGEGGVAQGTYNFETRHEMNDVSGAVNSRSGAGRAVDAPFQIYNGDDAHLLRIEATLDLAADGFGPGSNGAAAHDWSATQRVPIVLTPGSSTTVGGVSNVTATGSGAERGQGSMGVSQLMAQMLLTQIGKEAQTFWRSGKCIELTPSRDTDTVQPNEEIELRVTSEGKFQPGEIDAPITATFTGKESLDPTGQPQPYPPTFNFVAGSEQDDEGKVELEQVSNRGIGKRTVVYTVGGGYRISMDGQMSIDSANSSQFTLSEQELVARDDGTYAADTEVAVSGTAGFGSCTKPFSHSLPVRVVVRPSEGSDPPTANLQVQPVGGPTLLRIEITCNGATTLAPVPLDLWAQSFNTTTGPGVTVNVDEPTTVTSAAAAAAGGRIVTEVNLTTGD